MEYGIDSDMSQGISAIQGTLRGFHYQIGEHQEAKTITCITGSIFDVIIDLRKDSQHFLNIHH